MSLTFIELVNGIKGAAHGQPGGRVRARLKSLKLSRPIQIHPGPIPLPAPWPNPWDHHDKTYPTSCPRCGHDWSGVQGYYCPTCMGAQYSMRAA